MKTSRIVEDSHKHLAEAEAAWDSIVSVKNVASVLNPFGIIKLSYINTWVKNVYGPEKGEQQWR